MTELIRLIGEASMIWLQNVLPAPPGVESPNDAAPAE